MPPSWRALPRFLLVAVLSLATSSIAAEQSAFENTAIVRTAELGGAIVHVTTTYAIKSLGDEQDVYTLTFPRKERDATSFLEVTVKGRKDPLDIREQPFYANAKFTHVDVLLPKKLGVNATLNLVLETIQTHMTEPWPEYAGQKDEQALRYVSDLYVLSQYPTLVQRTKVKSMVPRIISYTTPEDVHPFAGDSVASKSGATVTYGPFNNLPISASNDFVQKHQKPVTIRYYHEQPVLEVTNYKRSVEISHWGSNINTQDDLVLRNAGPKLKGHFSRADYQQQSYYKSSTPHILHSLQLNLPPGINNVYYYDQIGNVSTSRLIIAPAVPKGEPVKKESLLEFKPRYPLMGGWNYTFTLGWDADLASVAGYNKTSGEYRVEVPIMTSFPGAVVDALQLKIVLPEGATDIEVITPYPALAMWLDKEITYLDSVGRPAVMCEYKGLTIKHAQNLYVVYKLSTKEHFRKPVVVTIVFFGLFLFAGIVKRIDLDIQKKRKTA